MTLPEGTWQIGIDGIPSGFHLQSATYGTTNLRAGAVKVTAGESPELRVTLGRGLAPGTTIVKGRVVGVGSSVELGSYDGPLSFRAPVAADGTFEFFSIPPGSYAAIVLTGGGVSITPVKVGPAGVSDLVITTNPPEVGRNN
jgi:hypothetical protein